MWFRVAVRQMEDGGWAKAARLGVGMGEGQLRVGLRCRNLLHGFLAVRFARARFFAVTMYVRTSLGIGTT